VSDEADRSRLSVEDFYAEDVLGSKDDRDALLDTSLQPRGPDALFDRAAELGVTSASRVLDVGCRDGRHLLELHHRFGCRGVGIEPFTSNLARAPSELAATAVTLVQGRAEGLPFGGATFDLVWVRDVLVHVEALASALAECRRVLRRGAAVLVFQMFATPLLEPAEADRLWPSLAVVAANTDRAWFERAVREAGLQIDQRDELGSEWREYLEEHEDRRTSRQLLRAARLLRRPERFKTAVGERAYAIELANCLWGVYQMIGKLSPAIYVLR
jgi:ubiquinone/menaquinone biosynthesis C-methylase UbiE